ncbi:DUF1904 family protein [Paenibacillus arenosi]|uniref:DUF1904 family protein n=1 Tax=Paenibacillus arenosi TaxID=2774142 RepID=A0ABR9B350_9BACL|nr:DUF1904 family protein [Paenibacillus arenosi]MBD8499596.1 DUF1904 family protein [Paenibacillus arenosi]
MPFLRFKGFEREVIEQVSPSIIEQFANIVDIPKDIIKIELLHVDQIANSPLSVEIYMFQREQEIHDAVASMIYAKLSDYGCQHPHIFYVILSPSLYYKEGKPLHALPKTSSIMK